MAHSLNPDPDDFKQLIARIVKDRESLRRHELEAERLRKSLAELESKI